MRELDLFLRTRLRQIPHIAETVKFHAFVLNLKNDLEFIKKYYIAVLVIKIINKLISKKYETTTNFNNNNFANSNNSNKFATKSFFQYERRGN